MLAAAFYTPLPFALPPEAAEPAVAALWLAGLAVGAVALAQGALHRRRLRTEMLADPAVLVSPYPRMAGQETLLGGVGLLAAGVALAAIGQPGVWQACLLLAYALALLVHRHFSVVAALAATSLASIGAVGLPLAVATVLAPPGQPGALDHQQALLLGGFSSLAMALVWAVLAGRWRGQHLLGEPISTGHRLTWAAIIQTIGCLLATAWCLAPAFRRA